MSADVIIVTKDVARRAESLINCGNVIKGVEMLLVENAYHSDTCSRPGPAQSDCTPLYKKGITHLTNTPFDLLGVDLGCKTVDVRKAYKKLALKYHPDKNPKTTPLFQVIQAASSKLSDATERSKEELQAKKKSSVPSFPAAAPSRPTNANPTSYPSSSANPSYPSSNQNYPSASAYANSNAAGQGSGFASAYPSYGQAGNANKAAGNNAAGAGAGGYYNNNYYNNNNSYYQNYYNNNNPNSNAAGANAGAGANPYANYAYGNKANNNNPYNANANNNNAYSNPSNGSGKSNSTNNNANNPYAQANAARKAANPADPSNNFRNDEAKRKNYYEDLLKEQYRKAAESDQRAREYAAKRAAEQRTEFDQYFKKQSQYASNSNASKATEPPLNSYRPAPPSTNYGSNANNGFKPTVPSAFDYYANINKEPSNPPSRVNSSHSMNSNAPPPNPTGAAAGTGATANANANPYGAAGVGRTYRATSDGKVYPQQQQPASAAQQPKVSPRPEPMPTPTPGSSAAPNTSASAKQSSNPSTSSAKPESSNKIPSFSNKKSVVPKPFGFRVNSIASTMVELEWSTSQLHHASLGVELSWKEKTSAVWEMSEKLIRSGCCRKKNLNAGKIYEFRVRSVEELSNGAVGNKSDWSDIITANLPAAQATSSSSKADLHAGSNKASNSTASSSKPAAAGSNPSPTNAASSKATTNNTTAASTASANDNKHQPHTPSKLDAIPQKFRRFNSKIKVNGHQMDVEEDPKEAKAAKKQEKPIHPSIQKVLSSSREAWGHDTLPKSANANEGLHSLEVDEEVDDEDDVLLQSKSSREDEVVDEEDEIAKSSEQVHTARPGMGKSPQTQTDTPPAPNSNSSTNSKKPAAAAASASPAAAGLSYDSDSSIGSDAGNKNRKSSQQGKKKKDPMLSPVKDRDNEDDDDDDVIKSKSQKSGKAKEEVEEDNYSDDDFDVEEETHYQLIPPVVQHGSGGKKVKNRGSKANLMEVLGSNGEEQYWHPVHQEPYSRAEVKGYVIADRTIVACATVGEWVRVKIHIMKEADNHMKKMKSYRKLDEDGLSAKQKQDLWGWCLKKDKHHEYLQSMQFKRPLPSAAGSKHKQTADPAAEFKTPPSNRKSLGITKNSFNNTSLFDLHIPVPSTANKENGRNQREKEQEKEKPKATSNPTSNTTAAAKKSSSSGNKSGVKITEWIECSDDMGNLYYYNEKTNESSWDPPDWIEEEDPNTGAKYYCHFVHLDNGEISMNSTWTQPKEFARVIRASAM